MLIAVLATDEQYNELINGADEKLLIRVKSMDEAETAAAYIILDESAAIMKTEKPVIINSVVTTLLEMNAAKNVLRINGWPGFIQRKTWEVAGNLTDGASQVFAALGKELIEVADMPGLAAARSISMIINEAYFALGEEISTKQEIDVAMKLGTNYPLGPFEWSEKIGLKNIYELLSILSGSGKRYSPAPLLIKEAGA